MPREPHPVVQSLASARYLPMVSNPLISIVDRVGEVLSATQPQRRADDRKNLSFQAARAAQQEELQQRLLLVLDQLLMAESATSAALRRNLIALLATREVDPPATGVEPDVASNPDPLLTTAEVAERLEVSRPYVAMLCKWGRLGEVTLTEGGHRRNRTSEVEAYLVQRAKEVEAANGMSPREAGVAAGLYDLPEFDHRDVVRLEVDSDGRPILGSQKAPVETPASQTKTMREAAKKPLPKSSRRDA